MKISFFLSGLFIAAACQAPQLRATSFADKNAWPLLPGQQPTVNHGIGRIYDSGNNGSIDATDMRYRVFVPPNYDPTISYPVVLWLHGLGGEGNNNTAQLAADKATVLNLLEEPNRYNYPCILVAPQRPGTTNNRDTKWYVHHKEAVFGILTDVATQYTVDRKRVYITGVSWGGMGTWAFLANNSAADPFQWAAGVPIAGEGSQSYHHSQAGVLAGIPLWAFHADDDNTVDVTGSIGTDVMINQVRGAGGSPAYTRFATGNHTEHVWESAYSTPGLLPWLMSQRVEDAVTGTPRESANHQPVVSLTGYRVGTTMELEGTVTGWSGAANEANWWNSAITGRSGTVSGTAGGGKTISIAGANFVTADVGSRLFINDTLFNGWTGYKILTVVNSTTVTVDVNFPSSGTYSSSVYEINPVGHWRNPAVATGLDTWVATGIPLTSGSNTIGVTGKTSSFSSNGLGGFTYLGGQTATISYTPPVGNSVAPVLSVAGNSSFSTNQASITLTGTASDDTAVTSITWTTDHAGSGTATGLTSWSCGPIPLDPGHNVVTVKASDAAGNIAVKIIRIMRDAIPVAPSLVASTPQETGCTIDVLASGTDADLGPQILSVSGVGFPNAPARGTATIHDGKVRYLPEAGYVGNDSFSYTITDGVYSATGSISVTVTGAFANTETVFFAQDFSVADTSNTAPFESTTPTSAQFNDIDAEADGGTWSISGGRLRLVRTGASGGNNGAGMTRFTDISGPSKFVKVAFDFSVANLSSTSTIAEFELCGISAKSDYNTNLGNATVHNRLELRGKGTNTMAFILGGLTSEFLTVSGESRHIDWYVNSSSTSKQYRGPDGFVYSVLPNQSTLWMDGALIWDNIPRVSFTGANATDFRVRANISNPVTLTFDGMRIAEQSWAQGGDTSAPVVGIAIPATDPFTTNASTLSAFSGTATDNTAVTSVTWANAATGGTGTASFTAPNWSVSGMALQPGSNLITITARDAANNTASDTVTVLRNMAPNAGDDTVVAVSGEATLFTVLDTDSDQDGPSALSISNVSTPSHGSAVTAGGGTQIQYTAMGGYYGSDSFTYTISDGSATDVATVNVTVIKAADLSSYNLAGQNVGSATGSGADLDGVSWEVKGVGLGIAGTSDNYHGETRPLNSEFVAVARVDTLSGGSTARAGLVISEGASTGARLGAVSIAPDGTVRSLGRTVTNAAVTSTAHPGSWAFGSTWLLVERIGDMIRTAVSDDGTTFQEIQRYQLMGLNGPLQVGLWSAGGGASTEGRAVFSSFDTESQPIVLSQDFDDWSNGPLSQYISATPTRRLFNDISASATSTVAVMGGRLITTLGTANTGTGFTRYVSGGFTPTAVVVKLRIAMTNVTGSGDVAYVELGNMSAFQAYSGSTPNGGMVQRLSFKRGPGTFKFYLSSTVGAVSYPSNGTSLDVEWYVNHTANPITYATPAAGGGTKVLAAGYTDLWVNGLPEFQDLPKPAVYSGPNMGGVRFRSTQSSTNGQTVEFDEIDIRELQP